MSEADRESLSAADRRRRRVRGIWIAAGAVLWIAVIAALVFAPKRTRDDAHLQRIEPIESATEKENPPEAGSASVSPDKPVATPAPWDPAGVKDFEFTDATGKKVKKADLLGHPWLICFVFTRCAGPCPRVSSQMAELQKLVKGSDVRLVTLTVDPDFDTAEVLGRHAQSLHADPAQWLFLRGDKLATYRLIGESFRMPVQETKGPERQPGYEVIHSTNIMLVNAKGVVVQKYNALLDADMVRLRRDLKPYLHVREPLVAPVPGNNAVGAASDRQ